MRRRLPSRVRPSARRVPPCGRAVIVKDGEVVGEGYTQPPGGDHAEVWPSSMPFPRERRDAIRHARTVQPLSNAAGAPTRLSGRDSNAHVASAIRTRRLRRGLERLEPREFTPNLGRRRQRCSVSLRRG